MDPEEVSRYIASNYDGVEVQVASRETGALEVAWGDSFFFYNPDDLDEGRKFPFATIVTKDYEGFDSASDLNREGVYRLNIGLSRQTYETLFPDPRTEHDFKALDQLMPHPVYGPNHWVSVLNPGDETLARLTPLLTEAYERAIRRYRPNPS
jgi:hypothetical protein